MAGGRSSLATSCVTTACQAGDGQRAGRADQEREQQADCPASASRARRSPHRPRDTAVVTVSTTIRNLRLSKISASAPAGIANRQIGRLLAACTSATINGSGSRLGHQPARGGAVHPAADIGDQRRRPDHRKSRMAERRHEGWRARRRSIDGAAAHQPGLCASQRPLSAAANSSASAALTASGSSLVMVWPERGITRSPPSARCA